MKTLTSFVILIASSLAALAQINIDPPTRSFAKEGGGGSILTSGSGNWTANSTVSWITIAPRTSGNATESCIYIVNSNFSADTRQGVINIGNRTHTVTQTGYTATLNPTSATVNLSGGNGTTAISVDAGVAWSAVSSNASWLTVSPASGTSSGSVAWTVAAYGGVTTRTASLTVAGKTFSITQTGTDVNIAPKSVEKAHSSDIVQVQVTALATTTWNATSNASWISIVDAGNKFGDSTVTLAIGTNPSFNERTGTVSIGSSTFTIIQAGTPTPVLDILPKDATASPTGAYGNVAVLATPDAPWLAESLAPWIFISQGGNGTGNGNIQYVASANPNLTERTGQIKVTPAVYRPKVDLTQQLECHVSINGTMDSSGWARNLSGSLSQTFNGTNALALTGQNFYRTNDAFTVAFGFYVSEINAVNRLFESDRTSGSWSTLYVDASNKLVFKSGSETLTSSLTISANKTYQVVLSVGEANKTTLYAGERGVSISEVGSKTFLQAPFPASYVLPERIKLGTGNQPTAGNLSNGRIEDLRIYSRELSAVEASAIHTFVGTTNPYGDTSNGGDATTSSEYNLRGQARATGGTMRVQPQEGNYSKDELFLQVDNRSVVVGSSGVYTFAVGGYMKSVKGVGTGAQTAGYVGAVTWNYTFNYSDGTTYTTPSRSSEYTSATFTETNPNLFKAVSTIRISYSAGGSFSFVLNVKSYVANALYPFYNWSPTSDRFGISQRALSGNSTSRLNIYEHQSAFTQNSATYNFWLKYNSTTLLEQPLLTRDPFALYLRNAGSTLRLQSGSSQVDFASGMQPNQWHMLTLSATFGGTLRAYVDGKEIGNTPLFGSILFGKATSSTLLALGGWAGAIDYAGFYNKALSSAEVLAVYNAQRPQLQYHNVTQDVVDPAISPQTASLPAAGGTTSTQLTLAANVNWTAATSTPWLSIKSNTSGAGSTTVQVLAASNPTVYTRNGTISVAGKTFTVTQAGLNASIQHDELVFGTDGGSGFVDVSPEGGAQWQAISNSSWLTIALGANGTGPGNVFIVADPYTQTSQARTGSVTIAGKTVYVTQRGYQLSINPQVAQIGSNAGAGEFGVAAPLGAVWEAIVSQPWITITGGINGVGSGTIRYSVAPNTSGATRSGKILVSGKEYTITQTSSLIVTATAGTGGNVTGSGSYETNSNATLTANASSGFAFSHWTGDAVGSANPLTLRVDNDKNVQAVFIPTSAATAISTTAVQNVVANPNSYGLYRSEQMRSMALGKPVLQIDQSTGKVKIQFGLKQSQNLQSWSDVDLSNTQLFIRNGKLEVEIAPLGNAAFYKIFGSEAGQ
jgi:hypothetical protein